LKVRTKEIYQADFDLLRKKFLSDINQRRLVVVRLLRRHFDRAEALIAKHGPNGPIRTMDALHLAVALDLRDMRIVDQFVCADSSLLRFATIEGLSTINPNEF
jgi:predicted nucleic acid-binding protein